MVFEDIAGQDKVKRTLLDIAESGRIGHAYLFVGPEGIGRKSIAKRFAQLVMCMEKQQIEAKYAVFVFIKLHGSDMNRLQNYIRLRAKMLLKMRHEKYRNDTRAL